MKESRVVELASGIYWVGGNEHPDNLHCNPYLIVDGDEGILIDPGSVLDFDYVYENVINIISLDKIKYVILQHQDPDLCSSVPLFEKKGGKFKVVTHWRTQTIVRYYGIKSDYYIVNENNFKLTLQSGRSFNFIQTPYLHFPGAITTYDTSSKVLFSSDLFGALSNDWTLFAQKDYLEKMKAFHEHYMPSNEILRPVMEIFLQMDISMIAPQHGSIIIIDIKKYIKELRDLECGAFLKPIRKKISESGGYISLCNSVIQRYASVFSKEEVIDVLKNLEVTVDTETLEITDYNYLGDQLWNLLFEKISLIKGTQRLIILEPFVKKLSNEYDIPMPSVFSSSMKKVYELSQENEKLKELNEQLEQGLKETEEKLIRCPITGFYNYEFFKSYLPTVMEGASEQFNAALVIISLDGIAKIRYSYGDSEVDQVLNNTAYIIEEFNGSNSVLFRLQSTDFAWYVPNTSKELILQKAEKIRNAIASSNKYVDNVTVSIGLVSQDEIKDLENYENHPFEVMYELAMLRVRLARSNGENIVCSNSEVGEYKESMGKILIVDNDEVNIDVLKTILENFKYEIIIAQNGVDAISMAEAEMPNLIVSEIMIPKKDAFLVRENLLLNSQTKEIPFIYLSHLKNENSVKRALSLGVEHYLRKPFMISELLGIIKLMTKGDDYQ